MFPTCTFSWTPPFLPRNQSLWGSSRGINAGPVLEPGKGAGEAPALGPPPGTHQAQVGPYP